MVRASWAGVRIVLHQMCYEAPALFIIFQAYFQNRDFDVLEEAAIFAGADKETWRKFLAFVGGFYSNMSNYHSFGFSKFLPELEPS
jgi:dipeptidyl-peptidase III